MPRKLRWSEGAGARTRRAHGGRWPVIALALCTLVSAWGCAPELLEGPRGATEAEPPSRTETGEEEVSEEPEGPLFDARACTRAFVPVRFGMTWEVLNHRVSELAWLLEPEDACGAEEVLLRSIGGDFTTGDAFGVDDRAIFAFGASEVEGEAEELGFARVRIPVRLGTSGAAEGELRLSREELRLRGYPQVVAFLGGMSWSTNVEDLDPAFPEEYDPAHGYTTRGIGARAEVSELDAEEIVLSWMLRFEAGLSGDRALLNRAVSMAESEGVLEVLLVGVGDVPVHDGRVSFTQETDRPANFRAEVPEADEALQRLELQGSPEHGAGFWGVRSFNWALAPPLSCSRGRDCAELERCVEGRCTTEYGLPGYYIRAFRLALEEASWDPESGRLGIRYNAFASNSSRFIGFFAMRSTFEGEMIWIQAGTRVSERAIDPVVDAGTWRFPLDAEVEGTWPALSEATGSAQPEETP